MVSVPTNEADAGSTKIENSKNKIMAFLIKNSIISVEISQKEMQVTDRSANEYNPQGPAEFRYINILQ